MIVDPGQEVSVKLKMIAKNWLCWFQWIAHKDTYHQDWWVKKSYCNKTFWALWHWIRRFVLIGPLNVAYWRGTDEPFESIRSIPCLLGLMFVSVILQVIFFVVCRNAQPGWQYYCINYISAFACVVHTCAVWLMLDSIKSLFATTLELVLPLLVLISLRFLANISAAPVDFFSDDDPEARSVSTAFRTTDWGWPLGAVEITLYVLDCVFSVFVIGSLVVFVWRGAWTLLDLFLYPDDENMSAFSSLIIGYGVVLVTFALQAPMKRFCDWLTGFWRIAALDCYVLFSFTGTINLWRGIWMLLNLYLLPEEPVWSYAITHIFPFILLVLLNCSNSLLVRGVFIDGEEPGGKCVDFPTYYLRMFFQEQRKKKLLKQSQRMKISTLASKQEDFQKVEKMSPMAEVGKGHVTLDVPTVTRF